MKKQFQSLTEKGRWLLATLTLLFTFAIGNVWAAASTSTDGKYASGTVDFSTIGSLSANTTYWHNGIKFFSGNSTDVSANTSAWSEKVTIPAYISDKTASNQANKGKWGKNGNGKQYTMSGFACSQHTIGVHVNQPCTLTVVVNKNLASDTNDAGISASIDATAYATAWTTSTYKVAGDALTVASTRADATNAPGRYTLTIVITNENLTDGEAVVKMFNGSSGTGSGKLFCWESITVTAAAVTKHHVIYNLGDATGTTPTQADVAEGAKFTLHNGTTGITAPNNKDFDGWHDGTTKYAGGAEYTMGTSDVELTAQWKDHVANYTVKYMDGTTELGSEAVEVGQHPTGSEIAAPTKDCYTFAGWDPALNTVSGTDGQVVNVNATWTPIYSSSATLISADVVSGKPNVNTVFAASNIVSSITFDSKNYEFTSNETKKGYYGYKDKASGDYMKILVKQGKRVQVLFGNLGANPTIKINGADGSLDATRVTGDNAENTFTYKAISADALISITMGSGTNTLKKVDIAQLYTATRVDAKSDGAGTDANVVQTTLPTPTAISGSTFTGWKTSADVKDSEDNTKTEGTVLAAGTYTLLENTTFTAQWAGDVYTVKFMDGETVLDTKVVEVGSHPADIEHPTKPLYTFAAWQLSGSDVVLDNVNGTKDATVILTARWAVAYASNVNFKEAATQALGVETALNTYHYASDAGDISFEEKGLKIKTNAARFYFNVAPGKVTEIKFGNISGATYSVDGGAAETLTSSQLKATYSASAQNCVMTMTTAAYNIVEKITIHDPYTVTFNANGGEDVASQNGTPSVTLPLPVKGTESFLGWFNGETNVGMNGDKYTPTDNITLVAHWESVSTDARLASISFSSDAGTLSPAFDSEVTSYTYTMPYGTAAIPTITGATSVNAKAQDPIIGEAAAAWGDAQTIKGVAQSGDKKTYTITMLQAPKDGVSIIKATINSSTKNSIGEVTGLYKKDASCGGLSDYKFNGKGAYIGIELVAGQTFNEGDIINIHTTSAAVQGTIALYNDHGNTVSAFHDYGVMGGTGDNKFALPASAEDKSIIYVCRTEANTWNGYVDYIEVTRAMNPILTAIQFNDTKVDVTGTNVEITLPNGTNLGAMTITPTIVWNGAGTAAAANAWAWDVANTYTVTDKDGDATVYTITLTEAVPAVDPTLTYDDGAYIVGLSALDMSTLKTASNSDGEITYTLKDAGTTGATIDGNNFTATAAGTATITASQAATVAYNAITVDFNVVVTEPAEVDGIKMVEAGALTGNFVSARTLSNGNNTVEGIAYTKYITMSSTMSSFGNEVAPSATKGIYYYPSHKNIRFYFYVYNNQSSAKKIYIYTVDEDAESTDDATSANVSVDPGRHMVYADVELTKHAAVVFGVENTGTQICQIVAVESGDELIQGGEAGYSIDYNKCYISPKASTVAVYDGIEYKLYADAKLVSATNVQLKTLGTEYIKFHLDAPMTVNVFAENKKYYVGSECSTDDAAMLYEATGDGEFTLAAGNWYINGSGAQVKINKLSFMLPKCQKPTISASAQPATNQTFGPGNLTATVVATVSDGGTLKYQWYNASNDEEVDGATSATLTTTTEGTYYVIVTNTLADHSDNFIKSAEATLGYRVTDDATLSALSASEGTLDPTFDKNVVEYRVDLPEGTVDVPTLSATATMDGYANVAINNATAFVNYEATSTVVVTSEDGTATKTYTVKFVVDHVYTALVDVTESTTWNWSGSEDVTINDVANKGLILANYIDGANFEMIEGKENERARRNQNGGVYQGTHLHFNTTVAGKVKFYFRAPSSGENCTITVINNGKTMTAGTRGNSFGWSKEIVVKGDVVIEMVNDKSGGGDTRVQQIVFTELTPDYTRNVTNNIGTLCVDHNVLVGGAMGATFYQIASRNELYDYKIDFEEVLPNEELKAGEPYIFQSNTGKIELFYGTTVATEPENVRGMIGSFASVTLPITEENKSNIMYIASNKLWNCEDLVGVGLQVVENRAYIDMAQVPNYADYVASQNSNNAPRRRVTLGKDEAQVVTGFGELETSETPVKVMIDGQIFIIRGEKMFDVTGKLVK